VFETIGIALDDELPEVRRFAVHAMGTACRYTPTLEHGAALRRPRACCRRTLVSVAGSCYMFIIMGMLLLRET